MKKLFVDIFKFIVSIELRSIDLRDFLIKKCNQSFYKRGKHIYFIKFIVKREAKCVLQFAPFT